MATNSVIRPTLSEIISRIEDDAQARLSTDELRRSDLGVFIRVIAGASHAMYNAIAYGRNQLFSDTADTEYLERIAHVYALQRRQASRAEGKIQFVWSQSTAVPVGTIVQTSDGLQYVTTSSPTSDGICSVRALLAGSASNISSGITLTLPNPVEYVTGALTYTVISGGADEETDTSLRERVLYRTQNPPKQGTSSDFIIWAKEVEGVGQVWCYPQEQGIGTVVLRIMDTDGNFASDTLCERVRTYINSKVNAVCTTYVWTPIAQPVNLTLQISPDTTQTRASAEAAIRKLFLDESAPGGTIPLTHIHAALSAVANETDHVIISPTANITATDSRYLLTVGTITWQTQA